MKVPIGEAVSRLSDGLSEARQRLDVIAVTRAVAAVALQATDVCAPKVFLTGAADFAGWVVAEPPTEVLRTVWQRDIPAAIEESRAYINTAMDHVLGPNSLTYFLAGPAIDIVRERRHPDPAEWTPELSEKIWNSIIAEIPEFQPPEV